MKLGEWETQPNGGVANDYTRRSGYQGTQVSGHLMQFISALHEAHERGEVVVNLGGESWANDYAKMAGIAETLRQERNHARAMVESLRVELRAVADAKEKAEKLARENADCAERAYKARDHARDLEAGAWRAHSNACVDLTEALREAADQRQKQEHLAKENAALRLELDTIKACRGLGEAVGDQNAKLRADNEALRAELAQERRACDAWRDKAEEVQREKAWLHEQGARASTMLGEKATEAAELRVQRDRAIKAAEEWKNSYDELACAPPVIVGARRPGHNEVAAAIRSAMPRPLNSGDDRWIYREAAAFNGGWSDLPAYVDRAIKGWAT